MMRRTVSGRRTPYLGLVAMLSVAGAMSIPSPARVAAASPPHIRHVWIIVIENESNAFGDGGYLASTLKPKGAYIPGYFATGHNSLDNYIALISGQAAQPDTQADCPAYQDIKPGGGPVNNFGQNNASSSGCVYDSSTKTIADQLTAAGYTWKGYMEDMGLDPSRDSSVSCDNAKSNTTAGTPDLTQNAEGPNDNKHSTTTDQYAVRHNPFMYFHSIIDDPTSCKAHVVPLTQQGLTSDLSSVATTPNYSFITPNLCDDGHDPSSTQRSQCAAGDVSGDPTGGMTAVGHFLQKYVPQIVGSPAFQQDGMLVITVDEAGGNANPSSTPDPYSQACCYESNANGDGGATSPEPGIDGPGGGQVGALVLSPFVKPATQSNFTEYNHFSLLRTIEDIFHAPKEPVGTDANGHLGQAGSWGGVYPGPCNQPKTSDPCQPDFGSDVFTDPTGQSRVDLGGGGGTQSGGGGPLGPGSGNSYQPGSSGSSGSSTGGSYPATVTGGLISISPPNPAGSAPLGTAASSSTPGTSGAPARRDLSLAGPALATPGDFPFGLVLLLLFPPVLGIGGTYVIHRRKGS
jgi:phosphatidylinositol-3-phosphatase